MIPAGSNPLLDHAWGISRAQDRVWAEISGIAPSRRPWERLFVVLQAYIDDSYARNGVFVLGGYIASAEAWAKFTKEWESLLPLTFRGKSGNHRFKMSEMAQRMGDVPAFYKVITDHVISSIYCKIDISDLNKAKNQIWIPGATIDWGILDAYRICFRSLIDILHFHRSKDTTPISKLLPLDQKIDFYFDDTTEKKPIKLGWDDYVSSRPDDMKELYGNEPQFRNDEELLGLQAADFFAWWVRKGYLENTITDIQQGNFGTWSGKAVPNIVITCTEDQLRESLISFISSRVEPGEAIYTVRFYWNGKRLG